MERVGAGLTHRSQQTVVTVGPRDPVDVRLDLLVHLDPPRLCPGRERSAGAVAAEIKIVRGSSSGGWGEVEVEGGRQGDGRVEISEGDSRSQQDTDRCSYREIKS